MYLLNNRASDILALAAATLTAEIAEAKGDGELEIAEWRRAVEAEAAIQYDEPPAWFYPVRQSLGAALLRHDQAVEAEAVFREALDKHVRDGRLLFGLWQSLLAQGKTSDADLVEAQFRQAWSEATVPLAIEDL
jgi:Flp pilus assembly protein TadD